MRHPAQQQVSALLHPSSQLCCRPLHILQAMVPLLLQSRQVAGVMGPFNGSACTTEELCAGPYRTKSLDASQ